MPPSDSGTMKTAASSRPRLGGSSRRVSICHGDDRGVAQADQRPVCPGESPCPGCRRLGWQTGGAENRKDRVHSRRCRGPPVFTAARASLIGSRRVHETDRWRCR